MRAGRTLYNRVVSVKKGEHMSILERVRSFLQPQPAHLATDRVGEPAAEDARLATAVLLLEMAYGDTEYVAAEKKAIRQIVEREFGISGRDAKRLLESAEAERPKTGNYSWVSERIQKEYSEEQRKRIVALVWKVVYADRVVEEFEEVFGNYVGKLVGLSPEEIREARTLAEQEEV